MTLWTLLGGFLPVAVLFTAVTWARWKRLNGAAVGSAVLEAFALTLFAALWFGSLGRGGWLLVFLLVGMLVAGAERGTRLAFLRSAFRPEAAGFALVLARYLAAGALLAWRLA